MPGVHVDQGFSGNAAFRVVEGLQFRRQQGLRPSGVADGKRRLGRLFYWFGRLQTVACVQIAHGGYENDTTASFEGVWAFLAG